jgi:hypothetical protein
VRLIFSLLLLSACAPSYSPLIRGPAAGAPGRMREGRLAIGGTAAGITAPNVGGPHLALGVSDLVALEVGGNFWADHWAMGWTGARITWWARREQEVRFAFDVELGVGVGVGGELHDAKGNVPDGYQSLERRAGGGYAGFGVALHWRWLAAYARVRLEESFAEHIPATSWPSAIGGFDFDILGRASVGVAGGYLAYINRADQEHGGFYQLQATVYFDLWGADQTKR